MLLDKTQQGLNTTDLTHTAFILDYQRNRCAVYIENKVKRKVDVKLPFGVITGLAGCDLVILACLAKQSQFDSC